MAQSKQLSTVALQEDGAIDKLRACRPVEVLMPDSLYQQSAMHLADSMVSIHRLSVDGRIVAANLTFCETLGYPASVLVGQLYSSYLLDTLESDHWLGAFCVKSQLPEKVWSGETRVRRNDGKDIWLSTSITEVRDRNADLIGYQCVSLNISETVALRTELANSSKLMQLGQLTATVAHEIRNPLGAIRTAAFVLERKLSAEVKATVEPQFGRINAGIKRCDKIITELLDFSRKKAPSLQTLPLDDWLAEVLQDDCRSLPHGKPVTLIKGCEGLSAEFDPDQLRQVVINLVNNACEAMAEKLAERPAEGYTPDLVIESQQTDDKITLVFTDNGPGISDANLARIREPLFTTKSFGVGLGIPAIERILKNHGGSLEIQSNFGDGASFIAIFRQSQFPLAQDK